MILLTQLRSFTDQGTRIHALRTDSEEAPFKRIRHDDMPEMCRDAVDGLIDGCRTILGTTDEVLVQYAPGDESMMVVWNNSAKTQTVDVADLTEEVQALKTHLDEKMDEFHG